MGAEDTRFDRPEFLPAQLMAFELIAFAAFVYGTRRDPGPFTFAS